MRGESGRGDGRDQNSGVRQHYKGTLCPCRKKKVHEMRHQPTGKFVTLPTERVVRGTDLSISCLGRRDSSTIDDRDQRERGVLGGKSAIRVFTASKCDKTQHRNTQARGGGERGSPRHDRGEKRGLARNLPRDRIRRVAAFQQQKMGEIKRVVGPERTRQATELSRLDECDARRGAAIFCKAIGGD